MVRFLSVLLLIALLASCTTRPGVRIGAEGTNRGGSGQIQFSSPF